MSQGVRAKSEELERFRDRDDLTIEDLVDSADRLLRVIAPEQTRYKVQSRPDVRTIRYYTSQGLLPKPVSYDGGRARYSGQHLLRLLLIKRLQADQLNLSAIKSAIEGRSDDEILDAISGALPSAPIDRSIPSPRRSKPKPSVPGSALRRLGLEPGGTIEISTHVLNDPRRRAELADNLEALAQWLRATSDPEDSP